VIVGQNDPGDAWQFDLPAADRIAGAVNIFPHKENPAYINKYAADGKAATANFFARRFVFDRLGLIFDNVFSGEDHAWNLRASKANYSLVYAPECMVAHPARTKKQIITKTKRLLPRHIELNAPSVSKAALWLYGFFLIRPPLKYLKELYGKKNTHKMSHTEILKIFFLLYHIRFVRVKEHYSLLLGASEKRK
jgi:GT2 family glycosyltransferase